MMKLFAVLVAATCLFAATGCTELMQVRTTAPAAPVPVRESEPNDDPFRAQVLSIGVPIDGTLSPDDTGDYYEIQFPTNTVRLLIEIGGEGLATMAQATLETAGGTVARAAQTSGSQLLLLFPVRPSVEYYLRLSRTGRAGKPYPYRIRMYALPEFDGR